MAALLQVSLGNIGMCIREICPNTYCFGLSIDRGAYFNLNIYVSLRSLLEDSVFRRCYPGVLWYACLEVEGNGCNACDVGLFKFLSL